MISCTDTKVRTLNDQLTDIRPMVHLLLLRLTRPIENQHGRLRNVQLHPFLVAAERLAKISHGYLLLEIQADRVRSRDRLLPMSLILDSTRSLQRGELNDYHLGLRERWRTLISVSKHGVTLSQRISLLVYVTIIYMAYMMIDEEFFWTSD